MAAHTSLEAATQDRPNTTATPGAPKKIEIGQATFEPMKGQVVYYRSSVYSDLQPIAICTTSLRPESAPLIVELRPGTWSRLPQAAKTCEQTCRIAREHQADCVAIMPAGRGDGSLFQGYGEVDVYEAIEAVRAHFSIDPDRISVTGTSMGGAATWFHASHYPDFWAAAIPVCGYCDYKLWDKPGGFTYPCQFWEEFSWTSRGAAYRVGNFRPLSLRFVHGEWDRAVGGGVPVEHSRQMDRKLTAEGIPHAYVELPKRGHNCLDPATRVQNIQWLLKQSRVQIPDRLSLTVHTLRHNRSHWLRVQQQITYGQESTVDAQLHPSGSLTASTNNVRRLALGPIEKATSVKLRLDATAFEDVDLSSPVQFTRTADGPWVRESTAIEKGQKRPGLAGPFGDIFHNPTLIVAGASGTDAEQHYNQTMARNLVRFFNFTNGGLHRGGIMGSSAVPIPILSDLQAEQLIENKISPVGRGDVRVDRKLVERSNLLLIGNGDSNSLLEQWEADLRIEWGRGSLVLAGRSYTGSHLACIAVRPHPDGRRYVGILSGHEPDAICWASHLGIQLLPDYLVFDHSRVIDWGFWNNDWR